MRDLEREMGEWYRCDPGPSALRTEEGEGAAPKCRVGIEPFRPSVRQWENKDKEERGKGEERKKTSRLLANATQNFWRTAAAAAVQKQGFGRVQLIRHSLSLSL